MTWYLPFKISIAKTDVFAIECLNQSYGRGIRGHCVLPAVQVVWQWWLPVFTIMNNSVMHKCKFQECPWPWLFTTYKYIKLRAFSSSSSSSSRVESAYSSDFAVCFANYIWDSNGPQLPLPHTLELRIDECSFEVQSTVLGWSPAFSNSLWRSLMCTLVLMFKYMYTGLVLWSACFFHIDMSK